MSYLQRFTTKRTPQTAKLPGSQQVRNNAGGYGYAVDDWTRLDRFLVLGSEGGTYYVGEWKLTRDNASAALRCIEADGARVVRRVVAISQAGRAPKNDPALFVLALAAAHGNEATRKAALDALPQVARIGTHLLHFAQYVQAFRGWGRGLRKAVARWYLEQEPGELAYQAVKYQQRDGWAQRDLLRLAHPQPESEQHKALFYWMTKGWPSVGDEPHPDTALQIVWAHERAKAATSKHEIVRLVREYRLPREAVPSRWLAEPEVWEALLDDMPMTALIRNLATLTRIGLVTPGSDAARRVVEQLGDTARQRRARVHPIAVLSALKTYQQGHGERSKQTWQPVAQIMDALDAAFYAAFGLLEATGKRWVLALDVSGSMQGGRIAGVPGLTPAVATAAMAMVTARVEPHHTFVAFTSAGKSYKGAHGMDTGIQQLDISPRQRLDDVLKATAALPFGGTDCALPMVWAREHKVAADVFVVLTDSETWAGQVHPVEALNEYRQAMGIPAKLVVVGMTATQFTIADPDDAGTLDAVGFDTATPDLIAQFAKEGVA